MTGVFKQSRKCVKVVGNEVIVLEGWQKSTEVGSMATRESILKNCRGCLLVVPGCHLVKEIRRKVTVYTEIK